MTSEREGIDMKRKLTVFEKHQLKIAKQTLKYSDVGALILGGPTVAEAKRIIDRLAPQPERTK